MNSQSFMISEDYYDVRVTEIHYHPPGQDLFNSKEFEFIELKNTGQSTLNMGGAKFTAGIDYTFPMDTRFGPGEFIVLASNRSRFFERYNFVPFDQFAGQLDNSGEWIILLSPQGDTICAFRYDDGPGWPTEADGYGYSLVPVQCNPTGDQNNPEEWRASYSIGGSPGRDDTQDPVFIITEPETEPDIILSQNYPNPFSEITYIHYELPVEAVVELSVFNMVGQKIATLVSGYRPAGSYMEEWNGRDDQQSFVTGGIYFYRLVAKGKHQNVVLTRKMILMK